MVKNKRTENNIFRRFALKGERDDDDGFHDFSFLSLVKTTLLATTLTLYVLNQQHLLPYNLSKIVSKVLFWPTLPITIFRRLGKWETVIDDTVILGGAPFAPWMPQNLYNEGVRGAINLCDEYCGPLGAYDELGICQLRLKTVDHFEPSLDHLKDAVRFIRAHQERREKVYVHCRAGHGRSAAVVLAWLLYNYPDADIETLNSQLCSVRNVRQTLWLQPNIKAFHKWLQNNQFSFRDFDRFDRSGVNEHGDPNESTESDWSTRDNDQKEESDWSDDSSSYEYFDSASDYNPDKNGFRGY